MELIINQQHLAKSGRYMDRENNPVAIAIRQQMPVEKIDVHQNRVSVIDCMGVEARFKITGFSAKDYHALVHQETTQIVCGMHKVAPVNPTDHDVE